MVGPVRYPINYPITPPLLLLLLSITEYGSSKEISGLTDSYGVVKNIADVIMDYLSAEGNYRPRFAKAPSPPYYILFSGMKSGS